ncbi:acyltransferase family protein [Oceanobacillus saliphilus]|uniref:acyltransferase family protein n=1 Tax=Oceanobacillus saliphilus TaxID=2925834 RepID=UPI00201E2544|nr:acyltransferase family protein [Oceanobacillus saliphilus]
MMKREVNHLFFIDNLKIVLIMLVVVHHAGQAYGPGGWWYFQEQERIDWLGKFFTVNAAFFMSLFFFLSAYFLPQSIERKGPIRFLKERVIRIGVPLLLGFLVMIPVLMYFYYIHFRNYETISFLPYYVNIFFGMGEMPLDWSGPAWPDMQFGHLWFLEHLLVYAVVLAICTYFSPHKSVNQSCENIKMNQVYLSILGVTLATFIIRIWYPIDYWTGVLGFIQTEPAHLPQYVSFFALGIMASSRNWLLTLNTKIGFIWLAIGIVLVLILYFGGNALYPFLIKGGANFGSLSRSFIETLLCFSLVIGLVVLFREKLNGVNRLSKTLSSNVFVVYFIHVPVLVFLQYMFTNIQVSVLMKFLCTAFLGIVLSFFISHFVWRKIPYIKKLM